MFSHIFQLDLGCELYQELLVLTESDVSRIFGASSKALGWKATALQNEEGQPMNGFVCSMVGFPPEKSWGLRRMRLSSARSVDFGEIFVNPTNQLSKNQGATWFESVKRKHNDEREAKFGARASLKDFGDIVKNNDAVRLKLEKEAAKLICGLPVPVQLASVREEVAAPEEEEPAAEEEEDLYANMGGSDDEETESHAHGQVRADPTEQFKEYMSSTTATTKRKNAGKGGGGGKKKKIKAEEDEDEDHDDGVSASTLGHGGKVTTNVEWMRVDPEMAQVAAKYTSKTRKDAPISLMKLQLVNFLSGKSAGNSGNQQLTGVS